jgi:tetratricopeptide (TPR) repeat protein
MIRQYDKAIPELEKSLEIFRKWGKEYMKNNSSYWYLGVAYHGTGQYKKERKLYKVAARFKPDDSFMLARQTVLAFTLKDSVKANQLIGRFISSRKSESNSEVYVAAGLGMLYDCADSIDKAAKYYRKALSLEPENPGRMDDLASLFIGYNQNYGEVPELMDKAMGLARNKVDYYRYLNTKGWALYKLGKNKEALEIIQKAWDEAPFKVYSIRSHLEEVKKAIIEQK